MTSSLVGSEMCIRDRCGELLVGADSVQDGRGHGAERLADHRRTVGRPVSYTHLTLPTICSV
eukprot:11419607-Prorocentrum_lima.AAC.1